uniref:Lectin-like protein BA14k n=1 Tax=Panagrellus redivivus TaxID=6233 RepID=A0A7E4VFZ5_PANRE
MDAGKAAPTTISRAVLPAAISPPRRHRRASAMCASGWFNVKAARKAKAEFRYYESGKGGKREICRPKQ